MYKQPNVVYGRRDVLINPFLNFGELLLEKLWQHKDKECLINAETEEHLTYAQLVQQMMNLSISLSHIGVRKGDVIAICSENRNEYFGAVFGGICAGAVMTTVNVGYTKGELSHVLNISKPKYVISSPDFYKRSLNTLKNLTFIKKVVVFGETNFANTISYNNLITYGRDVEIDGKKIKTLIEDVKYDEFQPVDVQGQTDTILILYSSGTTGLPKGVMLTHLNLLVTAQQLSSTVEIPYVLTIAPWYHVMGLVGTTMGLVNGRTAVYLPKFNVDIYLKAIETYRVTQITVVPPVLMAISKSDIKCDVSSLEVIYSGAAPLQKDALDVVKKKFPFVKAILQGYGMTECTLAVTRGIYEPGKAIKLGSVGQATACSIIKVSDPETGQSLGPNQRGEIRFKGPNLMKGYIGRDLKEDLDEDGFFKTGDIGYYDEDMEFFIVDRLKELIKYKGYQVPPAEIEAVLLQHSGIKDAGVVGIEDRRSGEVPLAFVVKQPGAQLTEEDVKQFIAERLSNPKHLRGGVRFIAEIPKNPSGKILRKTLRILAKKSKL